MAGFIQAPTYQATNSGFNILRANFDWTNPAATYPGQQFGNVFFNGQSFTLDIGSVQTPGIATTNDFKTLMFTMTFYEYWDATNFLTIDGILQIYCPATGINLSIGPEFSGANPRPGVATKVFYEMTGCIPIATVAPTKLLIGKGIVGLNLPTFGMAGFTNIVLLDEEKDAYINQSIVAFG